jgi:endonuclease/exonuclease/phosphatase family metal-dependent hydrolase
MKHGRRIAALLLDSAMLCGFAVWAFGHFVAPAASNRWVQALYLIPAPAVFFPGVVWFLLRGRGAAPPLRYLMGLFLAVSAWLFLGVDMAWHCGSGSDGTDTLRIVHWNLARPRAENQAVWEALRAEQAAVYVLAERPFGPVEEDAKRLDLASGYGVAWREISVVSRYPFEVLERSRTGVGALLCLRVQVENQDLLLIAVDAHSHPLLNPESLVNAISECAEKHGERAPVIVIGDFNTLRGSPQLAGLRERFSNAYEIAGCGWPYTWPTPAPLFSIDHAWVNEQVEVQRYRLRGGRLSDHARQVLDVRLNPGTAFGAGIEEP